MTAIVAIVLAFLAAAAALGAVYGLLVGVHPLRAAASAVIAYAVTGGLVAGGVALLAQGVGL